MAYENAAISNCRTSFYSHVLVIAFSILWGEQLAYSKILKSPLNTHVCAQKAL